jgi:hypothetical protein
VTIPLGIWLAFTAVSAVFLLVGASHQVALERSVPGYDVTAPTPASPGYFGVVGNWDANWYRSIAERGYPQVLPVDDRGEVTRNAWAFYPAYPMIVRGVMAVTATSFDVSAWWVSLVCGALAMILLFRLVQPRIGLFGASALVSCVMAYVTAPVLQVAYTEGLALVLIALFIGALERRWLTTAVALALVLSLTRPIALPLGLVMGTVLLRDWTRDRNEPRGPRLPVKAVTAAAVVFLTAGLWPMIAWVATGRPRAFFETQAAWPVNRDGIGGWLGDMAHLTPLGLVGLAVVLYVVWVGTRPAAGFWGPELRAWSLAYPLYLILASRPSPSILRYLMLAVAPLWPCPALGIAYLRHRPWLPVAILAVVVLTGVTLQYFWVMNVFTVAQDPSQQPFP